SGSAISSGVNPTRLRRGATGTPAALRRATARRERPPCAIGIESKSSSEFRAEEVPLLIVDPPGQGQLLPWLRQTNVWLRVTSPARGAMRPESGKFTGNEPTISPLSGWRCRLLHNRRYVSSPPSSNVPAGPLSPIHLDAVRLIHG